MKTHSPTILDLRWGMIAVICEQTARRTYKDVKLYPGGSRVWDWRETGTRHEPGVQPADVLDLLDAEPDEIILTLGVERRLKVMPQTVALIRAAGVGVQVLQTEEAALAYNALAADGCRVAALIHSTC